MNYQLWKLYPEGEINEKIQYWVESWEYYVSDFKTGSNDFDFCTPHIVLLQILDEIQNNQLNNANIKQFFLEKIGFFLKNDLAIQQSFKTDFTQIVKELKNQNRVNYLRELCKSILKEFQLGQYFRSNCDILKEILIKNDWDPTDQNHISSLSQNIIVEFILHGFGIKEIIKFPSRLFSKYDSVDEGKIIITDFPTNITWNTFVRDEIYSQGAHNEAIKQKIDLLTIDDRLEHLKNFFEISLEKGIFICKIDGLKGDLEVNIGDVNFYSPKIYQKYFSGSHISYPPELIDDEVSPSLNAAIEIDFLDSESGTLIACNKIDQALDIIRCYVNSEVPFKINLNSFYIVNEGRICAAQHSASKDTGPLKKIYSYNLESLIKMIGTEEKFLKDVKNFLNEKNTSNPQLSKKLINSLHWYRKGSESTNFEDKLLNYWIVIENLFTFESTNPYLVTTKNDSEKIKKIRVIQEILPEIETYHCIHSVKQNLFFFLRDFVGNYLFIKSLHQNHPLEKVPENVLKKCKLHPTENTVIFNEFIHNVPEFKQYITNKVISDKISYVEKFYSDNKFANDIIKKRISQNKECLLLIYRYRNLIVHNAHYDNRLLPFFVEKTNHFAGILLREVLEEFLKNPTKTHEEIIIGRKVKIDKIIEKIDANKSIDLLRD